MGGREVSHVANGVASFRFISQGRPHFGLFFYSFLFAFFLFFCRILQVPHLCAVVFCCCCCCCCCCCSIDSISDTATGHRNCRVLIKRWWKKKKRKENSHKNRSDRTTTTTTTTSTTMTATATETKEKRQSKTITPALIDRSPAIASDTFLRAVIGWIIPHVASSSGWHELVNGDQIGIVGIWKKFSRLCKEPVNTQ